MSRYVALLRGINVGGHRVTMDRLRKEFETLGLSNVSTFIASGNVLFETRLKGAGSLEKRIEDRLFDALGFEVETFLRTPAELQQISGFDPFGSAETDVPGHTVSVAFLKEPVTKNAARAVPGFRTERDEFHLSGRELYWLCRGKITASLVDWRAMARAVPVSSTVRNFTTVRKLAALAGGQ